MWIYYKIECINVTKAAFSASVFSVTWSSEIILIFWFAAQETFLIIINVENYSAASYLWPMDHKTSHKGQFIFIEIYT